MTIYSILEHQGISALYQSVVLAILLLVLGGLAVRSRVSGEGAGVVPDEGFSIRNILEVIVEVLSEQARSVMGDEYRRYFPVIGSIFLFILVSNLMGLIPGLGGATADVNTAAAWAVISFVLYNYVGIKTHGWKYIYQFMGPSLMEREIGGKHYHIRVMAPFFLPLEILLHLARILTLTVRLVANMFADHTVIVIWLGLVPVVLPAVFMGLGLVVSVLQAFVFSLLTMIYIGQALQEPH
ncbi:MAG: F0F1 ATP synthase subunit A [Myxococcota bacterium]|nr:F0F1 ATP synthase subunit A [Myxococcota bacterium]